MSNGFVLFKQGRSLNVYILDNTFNKTMKLEESINKKLSSITQALAEFGYIRNTYKFEKIKSVVPKCLNLWEIKILSEQYRFFCYYDFNIKDKVIIFDFIQKKGTLPNSHYNLVCGKMRNLGLK